MMNVIMVSISGIWTKSKAVFENEPVPLECPIGNSSTQKWLRRTDQNGSPINFTLNQKGMPPFRYYINNTRLVDEGRYECSEGPVIVLSLQLFVDGNLS